MHEVWGFIPKRAVQSSTQGGCHLPPSNQAPTTQLPPPSSSPPSPSQAPSTYRVPLLDPKHSRALPSAATTAAAPLVNSATAAPGPVSAPGDRGVSKASASGKDHLCRRLVQALSHT